jgi:hypothetical protein
MMFFCSQLPTGSRAHGLTGSRAHGLTGSRAHGLTGSRAHGLTGWRRGFSDLVDSSAQGSHSPTEGSTRNVWCARGRRNDSRRSGPDRGDIRNKLGRCKYLTLFLAVMSFTIGGLIYIAYRPESLLMFKWFNLLHIDSTIHFLRSGISIFDAPHWVIYSLPFALWVAAFQFSTAFIWRDNTTAYRTFWMLSAPVVAISAEALQFFEIIPGTFDIVDLSIIFAFTVATHLITTHS